MTKLPTLQQLIIVQVLRNLQQENGWASTSDIAGKIGADSSNTLRVLYNLQEMGWLDIAPHKENTGGRPASVFRTTPKGDREFEELKAYLSELGIGLS